MINCWSSVVAFISARTPKKNPLDITPRPDCTYKRWVLYMNHHPRYTRGLRVALNTYDNVTDLNVPLVLTCTLHKSEQMSYKKKCKKM